MGRAQGAMKCMSKKATDGPAAKGRRSSELRRRSSSSSRACLAIASTHVPGRSRWRSSRRSTQRIDLFRGKPFLSSFSCISMHGARVRERPGRNYHGAETRAPMIRYQPVKSVPCNYASRPGSSFLHASTIIKQYFVYP